uniref:Uncharacterized protein n=1 Tax=Nelumbo nucifera TaxID=4432 RepID=A0A822Y4I4_NELNU|nr:TPA_asm: hypothetical protein HUJ06_027697 [Nelumbo nucifera]
MNIFVFSLLPNTESGIWSLDPTVCGLRYVNSKLLHVCEYNVDCGPSITYFVLYPMTRLSDPDPT